METLLEGDGNTTLMTRRTGEGGLAFTMEGASARERRGLARGRSEHSDFAHAEWRTRIAKMKSLVSWAVSLASYTADVCGVLGGFSGFLYSRRVRAVDYFTTNVKAESRRVGAYFQ